MLDGEFPTDILACQSWIRIRGLSIDQNCVFSKVTDSSIETNEILRKTIEENKDELFMVFISSTVSYFGHYLEIE